MAGSCCLPSSLSPDMIPGDPLPPVEGTRQSHSRPHVTLPNGHRVSLVFPEAGSPLAEYINCTRALFMQIYIKSHLNLSC